MKPLVAVAAVGFLLLGATAIKVAMKTSPPKSANSSDSSQSETPSQALNSGAAAAERLTSFQMTDQAGRKFDSTSLQGKIWIGSIFFTSCPSTCRVQNERVMELQRKFGDRGVEFVSVTCDPDHDTPAVLADYARIFAAQVEKWHFLTADAKLIKRVGNEMFGITVQGLTHSDRLVLFNRDGSIVGTYRSTDRDEVTKLSMKIDELLAAEPQES